jgi:predicted lipoprotein with Yx(FWY)xxD motif
VLTTGLAQAGTDVDTTLLGTTERTDGATQVTYKGMPLYYFVRDTAAGDVNGQGVGKVWYVVSPTGELIDQ